MVMLTKIADFLLSEWLWSMTFAWSYLMVNMLMSWFFLRKIMPMSLLRSFILSLMANLFSFLIYGGVVAGLFIHFLQWWYVPQEYQVATSPLLANGYLGVIYGVLHSIFFYGAHRITDLPFSRFLLVVLLSNGCAIFMSYFYIVAVFKDCL